MIELKSRHQIELMRESGRIVAEIIDLLKYKIKPGITSLDIDILVEKKIRKYKAKSAFLGYNSFPANSCVSINEEVVHGIPSKDRYIKDGDIVSVDIGVLKNNYYGDAAYTYIVGNVSDEIKKLVRVTEESLYLGIDQFFENNRLYTLSNVIQRHVEDNGFSVVREYVGHGIGTELHEEPQIPNYGKIGTGIRLKKGMVLAIEPMVNLGKYKTKVLDDKWTVVTADGKPSAHFEHTAALTENGAEILTNG